MSSPMGRTSKEMVKPSSPTPPHLRTLKLSLLDGMTPPIYIPLIFFYKSSHQHNHLIELQESLKKSLSKVLTEFYPLAGRFSKESSTIDCNDLGALFVECKVEGNLQLEVIKDPIMEELKKYLPNVGNSNGDFDIVLAIQINLFDCGGIAVAIQIHHKAGDANSVVCFMNAWAATSRGCGEDLQQTFSPRFDMATLFPPKDMFIISSYLEPPKEKVVTKRLVLDKKDLENLKLRGSNVVKDPTRVEAVSSFLLKHFREASRSRGSKKRLAVLHAVNLRPRMVPPLSSHDFGNAGFPAVGSVPVDDDDEGDLVEVLRNAIRKIDGDFIKEIQNTGGGYLGSLNNIQTVCLEQDPWFFTSWTRFPFYDVDYGWGRPARVIPIISSNKNVVILMSASSEEDGIEAWVNLLEEDAAFIDFSLEKVI